MIVVAVLVISSPAEAQTTVWSGTITAERFTYPSGGVEVGYRVDRYGEVSDDSVFEYDGVAYGLRHIALFTPLDSLNERDLHS